jgi:signal transduction histidine kinase
MQHALAQDFAKMQQWSQKIQNSNDEAILDSINGFPYDLMVSDLDLSLEYLKPALSAANRMNQPEIAGDIAGKIAIVHYLSGSYDSSAFYNFLAIEKFEKANNPVKAANMLCGYGHQIKRINLPEAFKHYKKGLKILEENQAEDLLIGAYNNFGVLHEMDGDIDSAMIFYQKSLNICRSKNDSIGIPFALNNIATALVLKNDTLAAKPLYDEAYAIRLKRKDQYGICENLTLYGDYYLASKNYELAISWFNESSKAADNFGLPYLKQYNFEQISRCYEKMGLFAEALNAGKKAFAIRDSLLNEKNSEAILRLEKRYQLAEKEKANSELREKTARQILTIYIIAFILILSVAGTLLYLQILRRKQKAEKDAAIIKEREAGLKAIIDATEDERKRIARELHDGIGQQLSGLKLAWNKLQRDIKDEEEKNKVEKLAGILDEACSDVREISHRMMPRALGEMGLVAAISDMLAKSLGSGEITYRFEHFKADGRFPEHVELGLYRICQELINNIIKHSGATEVSVQLFQAKSQLVLIVEDNGKGFDASNNANGIGLLNIKSRLNTVNGEVNYEPSPESGTVATIRIPLPLKSA